MEHSKAKQNQAWQVFILYCMCAAMVILLVFSIKKYHDSVVDAEKELLATISASAAASVETYIERYQADITAFTETKGFLEAMELYDLKRDESGYYEVSSNIMRSYYPSLADIRIYNRGGRKIVDLRKRRYTELDSMGKEGAYEVNICEDTDDKTYFIMNYTLNNGYRVEFFLDCDTIFGKLLDDIRLGQNGYVDMLSGNGYIIMHPVREQIGLQAVEDRRRLFPQADISDSIGLINHRMQGETDSTIFRSYWWADIHTDPKQIRKICAYTVARFGDGFVSIGTFADYSMVVNPMVTGIVRLMLLLMVTVMFFAFVIIFSGRLIKQKDSYQQENEYLRELNITLENLRKSEVQLEHQQRLQVIGTMTGGIAHEFNNLLTPIMGYSGMMLASMEVDDPNYEGAEEIFDAAQKAKDIIVQIASLSRKNTETVFKYCNLEDFFRRCLKMITSVCPHEVRLEEHINCDGRGVLGNPTQLTQVMLNVCVNAFHATEPGEGTVCIDVDIVNGGDIPADEMGVSSSQEAEVQYAGICISDNGCGMDSTTLSQIFTPFFTTRPQGEGVGLGLAMVHNIIENHRGIIRVDSEPGEGTRFNIYLPVCDRQYELTAPATGDTRNESGSVLVVSDNLKILKLMEKAIKREGFETMAVSNAANAYDALRADHYDVVIADYDLRSVNGVDFAHYAKVMDNRIKIIVLTGIYRKDVKDAVEKGLVDDNVEKPVDIGVLIKKLHDMIAES